MSHNTNQGIEGFTSDNCQRKNASRRVCWRPLRDACKLRLAKQLISLPVLTHFQVDNYGLFPGEPSGAGIRWQFPRGLTLIAGINGLGKTTLLTMLLRLLTGPFDLTSDGAPTTLGVTVPKEATELRGAALSYFSQRVAKIDGATATLAADFGDLSLSVTRSLQDLSLLRLTVGEEELQLPGRKSDREELFQKELAGLMGVGGFVDVLLLLHYVVLFQENRPGALWDPNAQRHILRALFLEANDAQNVAEFERLLQSADSQARNIQTRITATERDLRDARHREAGSEGVLAALEAEQRLLDAENEEIERLESALAAIDASRKLARLEVERAKVEREEASGAIERLKYEALVRLFPSMDDATRLVVTRIMTDGVCLVCHSIANKKQAELEAAIKDGICPACGTPLAEHDDVHPPHGLEQARLDQARKRLELAKEEETSRSNQLRDYSQDYTSSLTKLGRLRRSVEERGSKERRLRLQLPRSTTSSQFESALAALRSQLNEWEARRAQYFRDLADLLEKSEERVTSRSNGLLGTFSSLMRELLAEDARLSPVQNEPRYLQAPGRSADRISVPAFAAEMTAADRPGYVRRSSPSDVSESQRELVDLAFRLALVNSATSGTGCTFIMETPEASLDGIAMERVGKALVAFASAERNRLVVTSNLSNSGLVTELLGGATTSLVEITDRKSRIINLLKVAKPNRALEESRGAYEQLLNDAIRGAQNGAR